MLLADPDLRKNALGQVFLPYQQRLSQYHRSDGQSDALMLHFSAHARGGQSRYRCYPPRCYNVTHLQRSGFRMVTIDDGRVILFLVASRSLHPVSILRKYKVPR